MMKLSLILNIVIFFPLSASFISGSPWVNDLYGYPSPSRDMLLSVYLSIAFVSAALLLVNEPKLVFSLLLFQVVYKLITPFLVVGIENPVVVFNVVIAIIHLFTMNSMYKTRAEYS